MNQEPLATPSVTGGASSTIFRTRWRVPLAGFLLALMGGLSYTWGVYVHPLTERFGWNTTLATLPFTVFMIVFAVAMVPAGRLQDRLGPRRVAGAGSLLFFAAYGLAALIGRFPYAWWLIASYGILGGIACGLTYACVAPPVRKWYPDRPALAVSSSVMGFGLAALVFAPLKARVFIPRAGIESTLLIDALMTGIVSLVATGMMRNPPVGFVLPASRSAKAVQAPGDVEPRAMLRTPVFWLLWASFALVVAGGLTSIGLIPSYGRLVLQLTPASAAVATSVFAGFNGFGRPIAGYLGDRFGSVRVMIVTCVIQAATFLLFTTFAVDRVTLYGASALLGWGFAATLALFPALTAISFGIRHLGINYGLVFTAFGIGALAPTVGSLVYDVTGSYVPVFTSAGVLTALALVLFFVLNRRYRLA